MKSVDENILKFVRWLNAEVPSHQIRGHYLMYGCEFIRSVRSVTQRAYKEYVAAHQMEVADKPCFRESLTAVMQCFGYLKRKKAGSTKKKLEKLEVMSENNRRDVADFIAWIQREKEFSQRTLTIYSSSMRLFFCYASQFNRENCQNYVLTLEAEGKSVSTIRLRIMAMERFGEFKKMPFKLRHPKVQKRAMNLENVPTLAEYGRLLAYLKEKSMRWYFIVKIMGTTGARLSELLQFRWCDVMAGDCVLKCKGNKYRQFFFTKELVDEVKAWRPEAEEYVCTGRFGRFQDRFVAMHLKTFSEPCRIDKAKLHPHAFRHLFAKMYLKKTNDVIQLANLMGHASLDTTRLYLIQSKDEQRRNFNRNITW